MFNFIKINTSNLGFSLFLIGFFTFQSINAQSTIEETRPELIQLFNDWRNFESPPLVDGIPDYSQKSFDNRWEAFMSLKTKLEGLEKDNWSVQEQVDWYLLWAEMNGYIFNTKILKP